MSIAGRSLKQTETEQNRHVLRVAQEISGTIGRGFFRSLTEHLSKVLHGDCVYVAELASGPVSRVKSLAVGDHGAASQGFEQDLSGTAASQVLADGAIAWSHQVRRMFPLDPILERTGAEGYAGVRIRDSLGQVVGLIGVVSRKRLRDPSLVKSLLEAFVPRAAAELERKRAEDALKESEQRYRAFVSSSSDAMWRVELEQEIPVDIPEEEQLERIFRHGYLAECNDAMCRFAGVGSPEELVGTRFAALFPPTDGRIREELRAAIRSGYRNDTVATMRLDKDGKRLYRLRNHCWIVEDNALRRIWGTTRDITDLKRAELAAEAAQRRFREILENIELPALMLNTSGQISFCNDCLGRLLHSSKEELCGSAWREFIDSPGEADTWMSLLSGRADVTSQRHFEGVIRPRGAGSRLVLWNTIILRNEDREAAGLAAIGSDITDQRALETRLSQAERLESIGRLAGGIAHDFNNLLSVIMGHVAMALEQLDPIPPVHDALLEIQSTTNQCAALTAQLLAIGRRQALRPELIDLNSVIAGEEAILGIMIGQEIELIKDLDPSLGLVSADAAQISRILANLATNARDAMPGGGTLTVATSNVAVGPDAAGVHAIIPPGQYVRLAVTDTGIGLTEDVKKHMFDPFFTTKSPGKGTGLGLSTVYGIIAQTGGYISARNESPTGTTVEILLPRRETDING